ncbi:hypothetical protein RND71_037410 [Anisodus tanguticus]|uniref:Uncharacterized protein n=1 Tax=Anisodus tanguticus TaxID=243964 RepID=A0AAE1R3M6_9SOLA|nr:hypothetical protein RND71_037410 [Anisodus tanguticus]
MAKESICDYCRSQQGTPIASGVCESSGGVKSKTQSRLGCYHKSSTANTCTHKRNLMIFVSSADCIFRRYLLKQKLVAGLGDSMAVGLVAGLRDSSGAGGAGDSAGGSMGGVWVLDREHGAGLGGSIAAGGPDITVEGSSGVSDREQVAVGSTGFGHYVHLILIKIKDHFMKPYSSSLKPNAILGLDHVTLIFKSNERKENKRTQRVVGDRAWEESDNPILAKPLKMMNEDDKKLEKALSKSSQIRSRKEKKMNPQI